MAKTSAKNQSKSSPAAKPHSDRKTAKSPVAAKQIAIKNAAAADDVVPLEQREKRDRRQGNRRAEQQPVAVERRGMARRKVQRRRQIDPTTCERDYSNEEIEFMHAIDHFKRTTGRSFPTCQDVIDVISRLGYRKLA